MLELKEVLLQVEPVSVLELEQVENTMVKVENTMVKVGNKMVKVENKRVRVEKNICFHPYFHLILYFHHLLYHLWRHCRKISFYEINRSKKFLTTQNGKDKQEKPKKN